MVVENLKKVGQIWRDEGLKLAKPLSKAEVVAAFRTIGVSPATDVIELFSSIGGMMDGNMDSSLFSCWTIERILAENKPKSELIFFADFLINSHWFGFKAEDAETSSVHIFFDPETERIADSFGEFFEYYLIKPDKIYLSPRET